MNCAKNTPKYRFVSTNCIFTDWHLNMLYLANLYKYDWQYTITQLQTNKLTAKWLEFTHHLALQLAMQLADKRPYDQLFFQCN